MHFNTAFITILPLALAYPNRRSIREWAPPGPNDSRGPCPGLNTLANHGYLPHDGRNITPELITAAAQQAFNWDPPVAMFLASTTINTSLGLKSVDLEGLNKPNVTEHHASLTRLDATEGDSLHLNPAMLEALFADSDDDYLDIASLGRSRARVEAHSPSGPLRGNMNNQANLEAAAILTTFPDVSDWASEDFASLRACKSRLRVFFTEERLPTEMGWETPIHKLTLSDLGPFSAAIEAAKKN